MEGRAASSALTDLGTLGTLERRAAAQQLPRRDRAAAFTLKATHCNRAARRVANAPCAGRSHRSGTVSRGEWQSCALKRRRRAAAAHGACRPRRRLHRSSTSPQCGAAIAKRRRRVTATRGHAWPRHATHTSVTRPATHASGPATRAHTSAPSSDAIARCVQRVGRPVARHVGSRCCSAATQSRASTRRGSALARHVLRAC